jgi:hypothetical protein
MNDRTIEVPVAGLFTSRPAGDSRPAEVLESWERAAQTPGLVTFRSDCEYQFQFHGVPDVGDAEFESLVKALDGVQQLAALDLFGCAISERGFKQIGALPGLRLVKFSGITDRGFSSLASLPELNELNVEGSAAVTDRGAELAGRLVRLKSLSLRSCSSVTDRGVCAFAGLTELESIDLSGCPSIGNSGLAVLAGLPKLHTVWLMGCWRITDRGIAMLAGMPVLKSVGLSQASGFVGRLARKIGVCRDARFAAFSPGALARLQEAHPNCDISLEMVW